MKRMLFCMFACLSFGASCVSGFNVENVQEIFQPWLVGLTVSFIGSGICNTMGGIFTD